MSIDDARPQSFRRPCANGLAVVAAMLGLVSACAQSLGPAAAGALRYERHAIEAGQWWRLATGHVVHLGWAHLALNALGLALVSALLGRCFDAWQWAFLSLVASLGVSAGLWWFDPQVAWYVGLSGMAHGLVAAGALAAWKRDARVGMAWLGGLAAKLAWEQWQGPMASSAAIIGGATVVDAHLYGSLAGLVGAWALLAWQGFRASRP